MYVWSTTDTVITHLLLYNYLILIWNYLFLIDIYPILIPIINIHNLLHIIFVFSQVSMSVSLGQNYVRTYPPNPFFDGASSIYQTHLEDPNIVGTIETSDVLSQQMSSASTSNAFGNIMVMSSSRSSVFKESNVYPMTLQLASTTFVEAQIIGLLVAQVYQWSAVAIFLSVDTVGVDSYTSFLQTAPPILVEYLIVTGEKPSVICESGHIWKNDCFLSV